MSRTAVIIVAGLAGPLFAVPAPPAAATVDYIDLKDFANVKLKDNLHSDNFADNNLDKLPAGKGTFAEVKFNIGESLLQLGSSQVKQPDKIAGIKVGLKCKKLHFLHATGYGSETDADATIAKYVVNYDDKTTAEIPVVYGKDVVDWWAYPDKAGPTEGKVAWEGENEASKGFKAKIKLYLKTWDNPHPGKKVVTLDFVATAPDKAPAPFCVAITAENK